MGCKQLGICRFSEFQVIGNMKRFSGQQCGEIAKNRQFSQNSGRKSAFFRQRQCIRETSKCSDTKRGVYSSIFADFRSSRISGTRKSFQLNSAGKQLKIVNSRKIRVESRHFFGITLVSGKLLNVRILNGVYIARYLPIFGVLGHREHEKVVSSTVRGNS